MIKSKYDKRKYKIITLHNKLEVMLISDKNTQRSAASMHVGVGYMNDPLELPGLAHYLEHMMSQGSTKYPDKHYIKNITSKYKGY